ncbi:MAG: adenine phosphoribosyltransferase [Actinomycetota bacterium]
MSHVTPVDLDAIVRRIPNHPKPGILFFDLMPLFEDPAGLGHCVERIGEWGAERRVDVVVGAEARGFILGGAIAHRLGVGFAAARKPGKLPSDTVRHEYELEYGTDALELHQDAIAPGARVLVHDDLLATGGTALATCKLVEKLGGVVAGVAFIAELTFLPGREKLAGYDVMSLITFGVEAA